MEDEFSSSDENWEEEIPLSTLRLLDQGIGDDSSGDSEFSDEDNEPLRAAATTSSTSPCNKNVCDSDYIWKDVEPGVVKSPPLTEYNEDHGIQKETGITETSKPIDLLRLFMSIPFMTRLAELTNYYADRERQKDPSAHKMAWKKVDLQDIICFLGLALIMGLVNKPTIKEYWALLDVILTPIFARVMTRDRFTQILRFDLADEDHPVVVVVHRDMESDDCTFTIPKDRFGGIVVDSKKIDFTSDEDFAKKFKASIQKWKAEGVRGLWIKIAKEHASIISICVQCGFDFHHAQPGYVLMKTWLPTDERDMLPAYANQYLGCAGFVVNEKEEVLLIKEKYSPGQARWKFPGGMADPGEEVAEAARREVVEETGVDSEFECVLTFRHQHNFRHGCSDFYFVCLMRARSTDINVCTQEIADSCWMKVEDYLNHPDITDANRYAAEKYRQYRETGQCIVPEAVLNYKKTGTHLIYSSIVTNSPQTEPKK